MEAKEKKVEQKPWKGARMFGERKKKKDSGGPKKKRGTHNGGGREGTDRLFSSLFLLGFSHGDAAQAPASRSPLHLHCSYGIGDNDFIIQ